MKWETWGENVTEKGTPGSDADRLTKCHILPSTVSEVHVSSDPVTKRLKVRYVVLGQTVHSLMEK